MTIRYSFGRVVARGKVLCKNPPKLLDHLQFYFLDGAAGRDAIHVFCLLNLLPFSLWNR